MQTCEVDSNFFELVKALAAHKSGFPEFLERIDKAGLKHISYTRASTVNFCSYRYLLEYVQHLVLDPIPLYFAKGRLFHQAAAVLYNGLMRDRKLDHDAAMACIQDASNDQDRLHLTRSYP